VSGPPDARDRCPDTPHALGQGLVEYGLILALMAVVAVVVLVFFGDAIAAALEIIADEIDRASR